MNKLREKELLNRLQLLIEDILRSDNELNELLESIKKDENCRDVGNIIIRKLLEHSDKSDLRVIEDLVDLLIKKNLISNNDLPDSVTKKLNIRKGLRKEMEELCK